MNDGEGSARRYIERRARISRLYQHISIVIPQVLTFMISIQDIMICISQRELIGNRRLLAALSVLVLPRIIN